jgi:hypothetical protein
MKTFLRLINIVLAPILTVVFAQLIATHLAGKLLGEKDTAQALGVVAAGVTVLAIELLLGRGPKFSRFLRRWLDPRALFEGFWIQEVYSGQQGNRLGCFSFKYDRAADTYSVTGNAYSEGGRRWAKWRSSHIFFTPQVAEVDYLWEGEEVGGAINQPEVEKHGLTNLKLRVPGSARLPMRGEGSVSHLDERSKVSFTLRRVTAALLRELGLSFELSALMMDEHDEEAALARAFLAHETAVNPTRTDSLSAGSGAAVSTVRGAEGDAPDLRS